MQHWIRKEKGNALIIGALSFAVLAAFGVLTIDVGRIFVTHTMLQNAADAGALAGASLYCEQGNPAEADVRNQVRLVGGAHKALGMTAAEPITIPDGQIQIETDPNDPASHIVKVDTQITTRQYFLNLLKFAGGGNSGGTSDDVHAKAWARCGATCGVQCVKPFSIPDRWDDITPIPGYTGGNKRPNWQNDGKYEQEDFTDANDNSLWDKGEAFVDGNGNGEWDHENYHPNLTGYIPDPYPGNTFAPSGDLGLELMLHPGQPGDAPVPGQYYSVDLPPINRGTPITGGDEYRENIATCNTSDIFPGDWLQTENGLMAGPTNQGMRDLIAQDPDAYWDPITRSVQGSHFAISPRIVLIPMHDPRIALNTGKTKVQVVKVAAYFMEEMTGPAEVKGRFLKVRAPGVPCVAGAGGVGGVSFTYSLSLIR